MIVYLTSSPGGQYKVDGKRIPASLNNENGFVDSLKKKWKADAKVIRYL